MSLLESCSLLKFSLLE